MTLDINRIHDVMTGQIQGRGCGRTTTMLVKALHLIDMVDRDTHVFIFCGTAENAYHIRVRAFGIAQDMGYSYISKRAYDHSRELTYYNEENRCKITFYFIGRENILTKTAGILAADIYYFHDHYHGELLEREWKSHLPPKDRYKQEYCCDFVSFDPPPSGKGK